MRSIPEEINTTELCSYGCNQIAKYKNKSGNLMCSQFSNSCPEIKKKNSNGLLKSYKNGEREDSKERYKNLPQETKDKMNWNKGNRYADFSYGGKGQHKSALIQERGYKCERCGTSDWMGEPVPIEMEHISGDRSDNTRANLKLLCLNCHGQTPTWKRGKNGGGWKVKKYSDEEMIKAIQESTCISQVLKKLDLRYGSTTTIINVMFKYMVRFKEVE
jgi:hypothetical protein